MIDQKRELEFLEMKYKEMKKLNSETEDIILKLKSSEKINAENKLLEKNNLLEKELKELKLKLEEKNKMLKEFQTSNLILMEELKETKRTERNKEIKKFQNIAAKKLKIDLEDNIITKLNNFQNELIKKIKNSDEELMKNFSDDSRELRNELKVINEKIEILTRETIKKAEQKRLEIEKESSVFHNEIQKEYDFKENEYLFEKEKKKLLLERFIGLKGFNILGVISIFLGIFLVFRTQFIHIFNNNYIKSAGSYFLGIIFLFTGEKLYQNNKKHFAVGMIGGGIGILYLATMLSAIYLRLFPMFTGLFIALLLTGTAVLLALRYMSEIIGILALIGGYIPYGAYIYYLKGNSQIYYLIFYSLILQGIVLGIAWKKDWFYTKIIGFIIGAVNMSGLIFYLNYMMNYKLISFFYIVVFTAAYNFIFLNTSKKEKRESKFIEYILLSINLILKFSLIYSLSDETTPAWLKAALIISIGVIYGIIGDKTKESNMSKIFYSISLGCLILIIPVILSKEYTVIAWGGETLFLYYLLKKYKNKDMEYAIFFIYLVTFISNLFIRTEKYYLVYMQDFMLISISFIIYFILIKRNLKKYMYKILKVYKYIMFLYSIYFIGNFTALIIDKIPYIRYVERNIITVIIAVFLINIILRNITYKIKEMQDNFSLAFLAIIELMSILIVNTCNFPMKNEYHLPLIYILQAAVIGINIYLYLYGRKDIHLSIFKSREKDFKWILGESIYILAVSYIIMENILNIKNVSLILNIIGLAICWYLVWKGFKTPNRTVRRTGLAIGIFFSLKCFFYDFIKFDNHLKLFAYFIVGIILIGTSYIYQSALKKLENEGKNE